MYQNIESEKACLGSCLIDKNAFIETAEVLIPEDFSKKTHKIIFRTMLTMLRENIGIDMVTMTSFLDENKMLDDIGVVYLTTLINSVPTSKNITHYNNLILETSLKRKQYELLVEVENGKKEIEKAMTELGDLTKNEVKEETFQSILENTMMNTLKGTEFTFQISALNKYLGGLDKGELLTIGGYTSQGKCLKKSTDVVMFSGCLKKVEDIEIGDLVMGIDSCPRKVMSTHSGYDDMWEIQQHHGINYTVNREHILALRKSDHAERYNHYPNYDRFISMPIKDYMNRSRTFRKHFQGYRTGIDFVEQDVSIEPYFLGVWLEGGDTDRTAITTIDKEINDYLYDYANVLDLAISSSKESGKVNHYMFERSRNGNDKNVLTKYLEQYNLIKNKHIPDDYLYNTEEIRLQVLAGIIDTNGYTNSNGYIIIQKDKYLSDQIHYLASSLGLKCSIKKTIRSIKDKNFQREHYKIEIRGDTYKIPIKIHRKRINKSSTRGSSTTGFDIEYKGIDEYFGFTLDGDGLFLLKDFTVVHNSDLAIQLAIDFAIKGKKVLFLSTEMLPAEIGRRILGNMGSVNVMDLRKGLLNATEREELEFITREIGERWGINIKKIYDIDDVNKYVRKYDPELLFLDYIQNLSGEDYKETTRNIKALQACTMRYELGTVCVSQLNRNREEMREPRLTDLRDTGRIEEVSNMVLFLYWKDRLKQENKQRFGGEEPEKVEILISKNRDGTIGRCKIDFFPEYARFSESIPKEYQENLNYMDK